MMLLRKTIAATILLLWNIGLFAVASPRQEEKLGLISTPDQIQEDLVSLDCKEKDRLPAVQALLEKMGAQASEITVEKFKGVENLTVKKKGKSEEFIIVGAHYDHASLGCGAVDNWTGVVAMAHTFRTVRQMFTNKTIIFVAFGKEEEGRLGSKAMARSLEKSQRPQYCAMVNIDSLGMGKPQVIENISSKRLTSRAAELAEQIKSPFSKQVFYAGDSDSASFIEKGIPAITIHGLAGDPFKIIHTSSDQPKEVNHISVYFGYRLVLALVADLDECRCDDFR